MGSGRDKTIGIAAILAASVMWAVEPVLAKLAYRNSDFLHTSAIRAFFVTITALGYVMATNRGKLRIKKRELSKLAYIALAGTVFADLMYFYALTEIPVINAVLIGHMQPIFIVLIGFFILHEDKLGRFDYLGITIMIAAGLLVSTKTTANLAALKLGTLGDLYVLLATVAWSTTAIVMRKYLTHLNAGVVTFYRYIIASACFGAYLLIKYFQNKSFPGIANIYQPLVGAAVGVGTICYYESIKRLKAAQVSALELSTPFFSLLLGYLALRESATAMQIAGVGLLIVGVYFLSRKEEAYF